MNQHQENGRQGGLKAAQKKKNISTSNRNKVAYYILNNKDHRVRNIANACQMSVGTAHRCLKELKEMKYHALVQNTPPKSDKKQDGESLGVPKKPNHIKNTVQDSRSEPPNSVQLTPETVQLTHEQPLYRSSSSNMISINDEDNIKHSIYKTIINENNNNKGRVKSIYPKSPTEECLEQIEEKRWKHKQA